MTILKEKKMSEIKDFLAGMSKDVKSFVVEYEDNKSDLAVEKMPTGFPDFDLECGGGIPLGRIIELYGPEGNGKTTLALQLLGQYLKTYEDGVGLFIDIEHGSDLAYAFKFVDKSRVAISQPDTAEQSFKIVEEGIEQARARKKRVFIIFDSIASLVTKEELEGSIAELGYAGAKRANVIAMSLTRIKRLLGEQSKDVICAINQTRDNLDPSPYAAASQTPGGSSLKYYAKLRIEMNRGSKFTVPSDDDKKGQEIAGIRVKIRFVKNSYFHPFRETFMNLWFGKGFDQLSSKMEYMMKTGKILQSAGWYTVEGCQKKLNGSWEVLAYLRSVEGQPPTPKGRGLKKPVD